MNALRLISVMVLAVFCSGCVVVTVAGAAASVGATVVGTAVDVAVGTVKVTGKAIGSAVDAMSGTNEPEPAPSAEPKPAK
jgi:type IV secretory pathway TrbL component